MTSIKNRWLPLALAATMATGLAACGGDDTSSTTAADGAATSTAEASSEPAATKTGALSVGVVANNLASPSVKRISDAFEKAAKAKGWKVDVFDNKGDMAASNNQADRYLQRGVDAILNVNGPNAQMGGVIGRTKAAKKIFVSAYGGTNPNVDAEIGTNESINSGAVTAGMVDRLGGKGNVVVLKWNAGGAAALLDRYTAMKGVLANQKGIKIVKEIEVKVPGQVEDSYTQLSDYLKSNKDVDAVWIAFDELAPSVNRALQQADLDKKVFVVGFNGNPFAWDLIRNGSPYVMEPANPFEPMGTKAADLIADVAAGKKLPTKNVAMRPCLITPDTVPAKGELPDWDNCPFFTGDIKAK
jgi:ribose transport system substrate-binding protein